MKHPTTRSVAAAALVFTAGLAGPDTAHAATHAQLAQAAPAVRPSLSARWVKNHRTKLTVSWGASATAIGRLRNQLGQPIPGAVVSVAVLPRAAQAPKVLYATTGPTGVWRIKVPGRGRSQQVNATYTAPDGTVGIARGLGLSVRAHVTLHIRKTRRGLRFWGRLRGPRAAHRILELQARVPGSRRWRSVRTLRTRSGGRYVARRSFHGSYVFRVRYTPQEGFGYRTGRSRSISLRLK